MLPGVMPDGVALGRDFARQFRVFRRVLTDQEERRVHAFLRQCCKHTRRRGWPWAVIERQYDLMIFKRQRLGEAF